MYPRRVPFRVPIEDVRLPPNLPAGMDWSVIGHFAMTMRKTTEDPDPIRVAPVGDHYRISDGRHRFIAAVIAGRPDVLAELD